MVRSPSLALHGEAVVAVLLVGRAGTWPRRRHHVELPALDELARDGVMRLRHPEEYWRPASYHGAERIYLVTSMIPEFSSSALKGLGVGGVNRAGSEVKILTTVSVRGFTRQRARQVLRVAGVFVDVNESIQGTSRLVQAHFH